jgi:hypothetical protein
MTGRPNAVSAVHGLKCADLVDAMGRLHSPPLSHPRSRHTDAGARYNFANLFYEAVGGKPVGKVIVRASNGYTDT